jgi:hypothetical protein
MVKTEAEIEPQNKIKVSESIRIKKQEAPFFKECKM